MTGKMKDFTDLDLGFANAENYRTRKNKELFQKYFVKDENLGKLLRESVYFLIGEKGTGKTAYSTYLRNNDYTDQKSGKRFLSFTYDVRQTEYHKFLELKKRGYLPLSQHSEFWRTILLILTAISILERSSTPEFLRRFTKLHNLKKAIDEFYQNAFAPEIIKVMSFVENSEKSASLIAKYKGMHAEGNIKSTKKISDTNSVFQTNLLNIKHSFEDALNSVKLTENINIFIDGIDVRPHEIEYDEYFSCVRGLIDATWAINNDLFSNIRDSLGRIKVVILVRPDIFIRSGQHNINTKIRDNSVYLDWRTSYKDYRSSSLFKVVDHLLSVQQEIKLDIGQSWDHYFPFDTRNIRETSSFLDTERTSFLSFLRFSYYRPRDLNAMMETMQKILLESGSYPVVTEANFNDPTFRAAHAEYLLGEIKDQLLFYYSEDDYNSFLQFFYFLNGKTKFSYKEYVIAFNSFVAESTSRKKSLPKFFESNEDFLQFLYDNNIICYFDNTEGEGRDGQNPFIRWCFRERTIANLSPKVRFNTEYEIFYGLTKALNLGRSVKAGEEIEICEYGTILLVPSEQNEGMLRGGAKQIDHVFNLSDFNSACIPKIGDRVSYMPYVERGLFYAKNVKIS